MRASVSGLMALLVLWFFPLNIFIHSHSDLGRIVRNSMQFVYTGIAVRYVTLPRRYRKSHAML